MNIIQSDLDTCLDTVYLPSHYIYPSNLTVAFFATSLILRVSSICIITKERLHIFVCVLCVIDNSDIEGSSLDIILPLDSV